NFITCSSVIIRRELFLKLGGFSPGIKGCEDWYFWLRCAAEGACVKVCREPLTRYRWHSSQLTQDFDRRLEARLRVLDWAMQLPRSRHSGKAVVRRAVANTWRTVAWLALPSSRAKAFRYYLCSLWHWPWSLDSYAGIVKCGLGRV